MSVTNAAGRGDSLATKTRYRAVSSIAIGAHTPHSMKKNDLDQTRYSDRTRLRILGKFQREVPSYRITPENRPVCVTSEYGFAHAWSCGGISASGFVVHTCQDDV